jgi:hypothetical protein
MAQTGYSPILIYSTSTTSTNPSASNLTNSTLGSELAINITDGKLYYKDNANVVQVIGWKVVPTSAGGTGLSGATPFTANGLLYASSASALTTGSSLTYDGTILNAKTTLRLSGATSGYVGLAAAAAAGSTTYILPSADGTSGQVLSTNGSGTLSWASSSGGVPTPYTANGVVYATSTSALTTGSTLSYTATGLGINQSTPAARLQIGNTALSAASWTTSGIGLRIDAATFTDSSSTGTVAHEAIHAIAQPTLAASSATTFTNASSLYIANAPAQSGSASISAPWSLFVNNGSSYFGSSIYLGRAAATLALANSIGVLLRIGSANQFTINANSYGSGAALLSGDSTFFYPNAPDAAGTCVTHYFAGQSFTGNTVNGTQFNDGINLLVQGAPSAGGFADTGYGLVIQGMNSGDVGLRITAGSAASLAIKVITGTSNFQATNTAGIGTFSNTAGNKLVVSGAVSQAAWTTTGPAISVAAGTYTSTGALTGTVAASSLGQPTFAAASGTVTNAATLYIADAPTTSGTPTITNAYSLYVAAGNAFFGGLVSAGGAPNGNDQISTTGNFPNTSTTQRCFTSRTAFTANATAGMFGYSLVATAADGGSAYTTGSVIGYSFGSFTKGANQTITNFVGFDCSFTPPTATNTYAFRTNFNSGSGKFGFYSSGTVDNAYAGNSRFGGVTAPTVAVDVTGAVLATNNITGGYSALSTGATAMAFGSYNVVKVTPNANATYTTTVPAAGTQLTLIILTSGTTTYTITFGTGFKTTGTLVTGIVSARYYMISFVSDGTNVLETARTIAIA